MAESAGRPFWRVVLLLLWVFALACCFAEVEIQIEGPNGWASSLPTWRVEKHWLLDIFWGGRPLTGYHAWVFSFMALAFHLGFFLLGRFSLRAEARVIGALAVFWVVEDLLWFVLNPAWGWTGLAPDRATWHPRWFLGLPLDYTLFGLCGLALIVWSFRPPALTPSPQTD
ncbi:MAG TPA: hypothetical protein P5137_01255 [Candidatus Brocadiia bacterium]|nr:hypothetical protein [Candidatus Brocadiia bacterium]